MRPLRAALAILLLTGSLAAQEPKKSLPAPEKHTKAPTTSPSTPEAQPASASTPAGKLSCGQCIPSNKPIVKGVDRWSVKTSLPSGSDPAHAKTVAIADFIALVDPPAANEADKLFQQTRIPPFNNSLNVKEGDLVTLKGWLWLVALENDGDYHIQISASPTSGDHCLIVEVPNPDPAFEASPESRPLFQAVRDFLRARTLNQQEPSRCGSVMQHPPYVQVTGQVFFDAHHVADPKPRGKKCMHAATIWELHPVVDMKFAPKPKP